MSEKHSHTMNAKSSHSLHRSRVRVAKISDTTEARNINMFLSEQVSLAKEFGHCRGSGSGASKTKGMVMPV